MSEPHPPFAQHDDTGCYDHLTAGRVPELSQGVSACAYVEQGGEARNFLKRKMGARGQSFTATPKRERGRERRAA